MNSSAGAIAARLRSTALVLFLFGLAPVRPTRAQFVVGTVRDSASGAPLPGVVVTLFGASNGVVTQGLTNARGQFRAQLSPTVRRFRFTRIGFRPRDIASPTSPADTIRLVIDMVALSSMLEPVEVHANNRCPRRSDDAATFALLQQARAGLLATVVSRDVGAAAMVRLVFDRLLAGTSDRIAHHTVRVDAADATAASFSASRSAIDFVHDGFMADSAGIQRFYAPDAGVLLDDAFAAGYCFRIAGAPRSRAGQVGLSFAAADRRPNRVDVDGTLWIDTVARALRDIDFRYAALPDPVMRLRPGGTVFFREVLPGIVLVDRWTLRLVGAVDDTVPNARAQGDPIVRSTPYLREVGGVLAHARWPDGSRWDAALARLTGRAVRSDSTPARGIVLTLIGATYRPGETLPDAMTPYRATTDSSGAFEIRDLVAGPYSVTVADPRLEPIDYRLPTGFSFAAVDGERATGTVIADRTEDVVFDRCLQQPRFARADSMLVFGRVMTAKREPVRATDLTLDWRKARPPAVWHATATYRGTGADGLFYMCAPTLGDSIRVDARLHDRLAGESIQPVAGRLTVVPLLVGPP